MCLLALDHGVLAVENGIPPLLCLSLLLYPVGSNTVGGWWWVILVIWRRARTVQRIQIIGLCIGITIHAVLAQGEKAASSVIVFPLRCRSRLSATDANRVIEVGGDLMGQSWQRHAAVLIVGRAEHSFLRWQWQIPNKKATLVIESKVLDGFEKVCLLTWA